MVIQTGRPLDQPLVIARNPGAYGLSAAKALQRRGNTRTGCGDIGLYPCSQSGISSGNTIGEEAPLGRADAPDPCPDPESAGIAAPSPVLFAHAAARVRLSNAV